MFKVENNGFTRGLRQLSSEIKLTGITLQVIFVLVHRYVYIGLFMLLLILLLFFLVEKQVDWMKLTSTNQPWPRLHRKVAFYSGSMFCRIIFEFTDFPANVISSTGEI